MPAIGGSPTQTDLIIRPGTDDLTLPDGPPPTSTPRRLPPPCWSHDETVNLIHAYCNKWYALRRGNLKADQWQDVADEVARSCPDVSPFKTAIQCRHKMEKLRKRYRSEIKRAQSMPISTFSSFWVHFKRMDAMEKGPRAKIEYKSSDDNEDNTNENHHQYFSRGPAPEVPRTVKAEHSDGIGITNGQSSNPPNLGTNNNKKKRQPEAMEEMVSAIQVLGNRFVKMEQKKMQMRREVEAMRMEMEMKRTEMILKSQQRILDAFLQSSSEKKMKKNKKPTTFHPKDMLLLISKSLIWGLD